MSNRWLRFLYFRYKKQFESFFVEDFLYEVPKDIREPAMTFLSQGKERLEKWGLFQAHMIQTRITAEPAMIEVHKGMLMMLKLLLTHTQAPVRKLETPPPVPAKRDDIAETNNAIKDFKEKMSTPQDLQEKK